MRKLIIPLVALNILFFLWNFGFSSDYEELPLTEEGIASLETLPEIPGSHYKANKSSGNSSCFTVGPYYSEKAAQLVAGNIRTFGMAVTIRSMKSLETLNYLVYLPPLQDENTAREVIKDIEKFNVKDYEVVTEGPYKNAISFGFFDDLDKAKRHKEYIRYLGYDARTTEQKVTRQVYWIDYDEPLGAGTPALAWSKSIDPSSNVQIIPRACQ